MISEREQSKSVGKLTWSHGAVVVDDCFIVSLSYTVLYCMDRVWKLKTSYGQVLKLIQNKYSFHFERFFFFSLQTMFGSCLK